MNSVMVSKQTVIVAIDSWLHSAIVGPNVAHSAEMYCHSLLAMESATFGALRPLEIPARW